jgi:hypothetical protein
MTINAAFDDWVERARKTRLEDEARRRRYPLKTEGKELVGPCPKCGTGDDRFSINVAKQLWNCRQCGKGGDVIALVQHIDNCDFIGACEAINREPPPKPNGKDQSGEPRKIVAGKFPYHDAAGALVLVVERIEFQNPDGSFVVTKDGKHKKTFRQKRPDPDRPGEWIWNADGVPTVPYRLPELIEAIGNGYTVLIAEGEAKVDLLRSWNVPATCCVGGAEKWRRRGFEMPEILKGHVHFNLAKDNGDALLTVQEAAVLVGRTDEAVRVWVREHGIGEYDPIAHRYLIWRSRLIAFVLATQGVLPAGLRNLSPLKSE